MKCLVIILVTLSVSLIVESSWGIDEKKKEAKSEFVKGTQLFEKQKYVEAAIAFRKANELYPSTGLIYNIAQCEAAAKQYGAAYENFEAYLVRGGDDVSEERREEVSTELNRLKQVIGGISVDAPAGSVVTIDNRKRGTTPLPGKIWISVSVVHHVKIETPSAEVYEEEVKVIQGEIKEINVSESLAEQKLDHENNADDDEGSNSPKMDIKSTEFQNSDDFVNAGSKKEKVFFLRSRKERIGWIAVATGAAFVITGSILGGIALRRDRQLEERCDDGMCKESDVEYIEGRDHLAVSSSVFIGLGIAAAVTGTVFIMVGQKERLKKSDTTRMNSLLVGVSVLCLNVSGEF